MQGSWNQWTTLTMPCNIKHLMTGPEGNSEFCFSRISMFPETKSRETLRFEGNKIHCSPRDQSLSDLLYSKTKQKHMECDPKLANVYQNSICQDTSDLLLAYISKICKNCQVSYFHKFATDSYEPSHIY